MRVRRPRMSGLDGEGPASADSGIPKRGGARVILALVLAVIILVAAFAILFTGLSGRFLTAPTGTTSQLGQSDTAETATSGLLAYQPALPIFAGGSANVTYPQGYAALAAFAVSTINSDREAFGLSPVTLGNNSVSQQHADSMFYFGYFSHYDTQGYKPYMRYTLLGGRGAVEENIAYISWSTPHYFNVSAVETGLAALEHSMMYNDSLCCQNGHRENILNALHNRVSIGVAYNSTRLYYVQDFESYYIDLNFSVSSDYQVTMSGLSLNSTLALRQVAVFYDSTPVAETASQLDSGPGEYDAGTLLGLVFPPCSFVCPVSDGGITVYATAWENSTSLVSITFSLDQFIQQSATGPGVYTLYLLTGDDTNSAITSISVFVN